MPESQSPSFNLWTDSWITLERPDGVTESLGIAATLLRAREFTAIYDSSPLVIAGIHRLLTAIAQAICDPRRPNDLKKLWQAEGFPSDKVMDFGARYADRFDLFSETTPFFQSADLPLRPDKAEQKKLKSISQLTVETSRSTALQHYRHGRADDEQFCPICAARGLVTIPMFTTCGGRGLKLSINGEPPFYILPGGKSLHQSLVASIVLPDYQPAVRAQYDTPWWEHPPVIFAGDVEDIGYLHSLTFLARRARLVPEVVNELCTRCGGASEWLIRQMFFEPGECRSKEAKETQFWQDPFVAYKKAGDKKPTTIRPQEGIATWREFVGLLISQIDARGKTALRPRVLDQLTDQNLTEEFSIYPVRCIGLRNRLNQPKVFEWIDAGFDVPPAVLSDKDVAYHISQALKFAEDCEKGRDGILDVFRQYFGGKSKKAERNFHIRRQMAEDYWAALSEPFRHYVLALGAAETPEARLPETGRWADKVLAAAWQAFKSAADSIGDDAASLRQRVQAEERCRFMLNVKRKKFQTGKE